MTRDGESIGDVLQGEGARALRGGGNTTWPWAGGSGGPTLPPALNQHLLLPGEGGPEAVGDHHVDVAFTCGVACGDRLGAEGSSRAASADRGVSIRGCSLPRPPPPQHVPGRAGLRLPRAQPGTELGTYPMGPSTDRRLSGCSSGCSRGRLII